MDPLVEQSGLASMIMFQSDANKTKDFTFLDGIKFGHLSYNALSFLKIKEFEKAGIVLSPEEKHILSFCNEYVKYFNINFLDIEYLTENGRKILEEFEEFKRSNNLSFSNELPKAEY